MSVAITASLRPHPAGSQGRVNSLARRHEDQWVSSRGRGGVACVNWAGGNRPLATTYLCDGQTTRSRNHRRRLRGHRFGCRPPGVGLSDLSSVLSSDLPSDLSSDYDGRIYSHENNCKSILFVQPTTGRCHMNKCARPSARSGKVALAHVVNRRQGDPNPTGWREQFMSLGSPCRPSASRRWHAIAITASRMSHDTGSHGAGNSPAAKGAQRPAVITAGDKGAGRRRCSTAASCGPTHPTATGCGHQKIGGAG
jgi:hypothetical protein